MTRRRPPPHLRARVDLGYRVAGQSVEIIETRPRWRGPPGEVMEHGIAKTTFVRSRGTWRVFWMRQNLKWYSYEPAPEVRSIDDFCRVVDQDQFGCFFG
ncbi:MAG: DUF3024 domain-containing protein [Chromatiales bacterium]|nr:DUF3024 domain-containing protein [Chromatiales bacterium]